MKEAALLKKNIGIRHLYPIMDCKTDVTDDTFILMIRAQLFMNAEICCFKITLAKTMNIYNINVSHTSAGHNLDNYNRRELHSVSDCFVLPMKMISIFIQLYEIPNYISFCDMLTMARGQEEAIFGEECMPISFPLF